MATQPSKTILQGGRLLRLLADQPREARTVAALAKVAELSVDQVEAALLAYAELGMVSRRTVEGGATFYLLGAEHLYLALKELEGLTKDLGELTALLERAGKLNGMNILLTLLGSKNV